MKTFVFRMYDFESPFYPPLERPGSSEEVLAAQRAQLAALERTLDEFTRTNPLSRRQRDGVVWHVMNALRPEGSPDYQHVARDPATIALAYGSEAAPRAPAGESPLAAYGVAPAAGQYAPDLARAHVVEDGRRQVPEGFREQWDALAERPSMAPYMLSCLNRSPLEYYAADQAQREEDQRFTPGTFAHFLAPLAFFLRGYPALLSQLGRLAVERYGIDNPRAVTEAFVKRGVGQAYDFVEALVGWLVRDLRAESERRVRLLRPEAWASDCDGIWFEPQLGPRRVGRWSLYAEPDVVVRLRGRVYVADYKTVDEIERPLAYFRDRAVTTRALLPVPETHEGSLRLMFAVCRGLLGADRCAGIYGTGAVRLREYGAATTDVDWAAVRAVLERDWAQETE